jgi:transglutaminase-like putative cysteine protease
MNSPTPYQTVSNNFKKIAWVGILFLLISAACNLPELSQSDEDPGIPSITEPSLTQSLAAPTTQFSPEVSPGTSTLILTPSQTVSPAADQPIRTGSRTFDVRQTIELTVDGPTEASRITLYVAIIQTLDPYQEVLSYSLTPSEDQTISDEYGNLFAQFEFIEVPAGETRQVELTYQVTVHEVRFDIGDCSGDLPDEYLSPETFIESNAPEIMAASDSLQQNSADACQTARAVYDYVGDEINYSQYMPQDVGALDALTQGEGDCTEFSDLFIALNRAAGIPARFVEGVTCCTEDGYQAASNKHDWSEVYLPGTGWVPVDATWGRFRNQRELYFAAMTPDHIIVTRGRTLQQLGGYHYFYYRYYWDDDPTNVTSNEIWSILSSSQ